MIVRPANTAIVRVASSLPLRAALELMTPGERVLDFGCGRGKDVEELAAQGYRAEGFDTHGPFGLARRPTGAFDVVLVIYVVNVLGHRSDRVEVLRDAWSLVRPGGGLFVASRGAAEIAGEAAKKGWPRVSDGFWSNQRRGMFQKGHTVEELAALVAEVGAGGVKPVPDSRFVAVWGR
jgi:SAM-dependent methyltransferase